MSSTGDTFHLELRRSCSKVRAFSPQIFQELLYNTAIRCALSPLRPCESVTADVPADPEAWHHSGTLSRSGTTRWRTQEEKRPNGLTMPRDALLARLSDFRLLAMASPHWMLVGSH